MTKKSDFSDFFYPALEKVGSGTNPYKNSTFVTGPVFLLLFFPLHFFSLQIAFALYSIFNGLALFIFLRDIGRKFNFKIGHNHYLLAIPLTLPYRQGFLLGQTSLLALVSGWFSWRMAYSERFTTKVRFLISGILFIFAAELKPNFILVLALLFIMDKQIQLLATVFLEVIFIEIISEIFLNGTGIYDWISSLFLYKGNTFGQGLHAAIPGFLNYYLNISRNIAFYCWLLICLLVSLLSIRVIRLESSYPRKVALALSIIPLLSPYVHRQDLLPTIISLLIISIVSSRNQLQRNSVFLIILMLHLTTPSILGIAIFLLTSLYLLFFSFGISKVSKIGAILIFLDTFLRYFLNWSTIHFAWAGRKIDPITLYDVFFCLVYSYCAWLICLWAVKNEKK